MLSRGVRAGIARVAITMSILVAVPAAAAEPVRSSHSGWYWGNPSPQSQTLSAVEFAGATGFASGDFGTLIRSGDFGRSWTGVATGLTEPLTHLRMLGPKTVV